MSSPCPLRSSPPTQRIVQGFRKSTSTDLQPNNINREDGLISSRLWKPVIYSLKEQMNRGNLPMKMHNNIAIICRANKSRLSFALPSSVSSPYTDSSICS